MYSIGCRNQFRLRFFLKPFLGLVVSKICFKETWRLLGIVGVQGRCLASLSISVRSRMNPAKQKVMYFHLIYIMYVCYEIPILLLQHFGSVASNVLKCIHSFLFHMGRNVSFKINPV